MFIIFFILVLILYSAVATFVINNLLIKNERYESEITHFYEECQQLLVEMRAIDDKQMFEKDDEVGSIFQGLVNLIGDLRFIIYGTDIEEPDGAPQENDWQIPTQDILDIKDR